MLAERSGSEAFSNEWDLAQWKPVQEDQVLPERGRDTGNGGLSWVNSHPFSSILATCRSQTAELEHHPQNPPCRVVRVRSRTGEAALELLFQGLAPSQPKGACSHQVPLINVCIQQRALPPSKSARWPRFHRGATGCGGAGALPVPRRSAPARYSQGLLLCATAASTLSLEEMPRRSSFPVCFASPCPERRTLGRALPLR